MLTLCILGLSDELDNAFLHINRILKEIFVDILAIFLVFLFELFLRIEVFITIETDRHASILFTFLLITIAMHSRVFRFNIICSLLEILMNCVCPISTFNRFHLFFLHKSGPHARRSIGAFHTIGRWPSCTFHPIFSWFIGAFRLILLSSIVTCWLILLSSIGTWWLILTSSIGT